MKKIFLMMLAAVLFAACGDDEKDEPIPAPTPAIEFADYSSTIGMGYTQMLNTYGEPAMAFGNFFSYEIGDGKTESLTVMTNTENDKVYMVMQILAENAYKFEDICTYFASKYTMYEYRESGMIEEDGEEYEAAASARFGNAEKEENATLIIELNGNTSVSYVDPTNMPAEPTGTDFSNIAPENVPAMFLGRNWEDVKAEYGNAIQEFGGYIMINVEDNIYNCIFFEIEDGIVSKLQLLFDDLEDEDVIAYYEALGYTAMDCGEEDGVHMYLFMNMETMDMFTYSGGIATFVYVDPNAEEEDGEDED